MAIASTLLRVNSRVQSLLAQCQGQADAPNVGLTITVTIRGDSMAAANRRVTRWPASPAATAASGARDDCTAYPTAVRATVPRTQRRLRISKPRTGVSLPGLPVTRMSTSCAAASASAPQADARASFNSDHDLSEIVACDR
jgi:hypothetical protein